MQQLQQQRQIAILLLSKVNEGCLMRWDLEDDAMSSQRLLLHLYMKTNIPSYGACALSFSELGGTDSAVTV